MKVVQIIKDNINQGVKDNSENTMISCNRFVDDMSFSQNFTFHTNGNGSEYRNLVYYSGVPKLED